MSLMIFIAHAPRNEWISEPGLPGLELYVRKSLHFPGAIELANVTSDETTPGAYWRFLRRYSADVPFYAEQTINPRLAEFYRRSGWLERQFGDSPHFASPLLVKTYRKSESFLRLFGKEEA